ncbi:MAG: D-aminoacyl-tRNA deacylase [Elusimicrobia bacterium]|nr:D-aminoacyl-tRNA deacylase [Elusimicrobiota bacterium]
MKSVIQRVKSASVSVNGGPKKEIKEGLVVLLGIGNADDLKDIEWIAEKIQNLRIFSNEDGKFDKSITDIKGDILVISQFTLYGDCRKGRRPDFTEAAKSEKAIPLYEKFVQILKKSGLKVETGEFGAHMLVEINNDGPVTITIDSKQ